MSDLISRQAAIDAFDCTDDLIVGGSANAQNVVNYINKVVGKIKALPSEQPEVDCQKCIFYGFSGFKQFQTEQPEIIRCKDCLMHGVCRFEQGLGLYGYCSQAERKTDETD